MLWGWLSPKNTKVRFFVWDDKPACLTVHSRQAGSSASAGIKSKLFTNKKYRLIGLSAF